MRIIGLDEFLTMKPGTVFMKYQPMVFGELMVMQGKCGDYDFYCESITDCVRSNGSDEFFDVLNAAKEDSAKSIPLDFNYTGRDGCYDGGQLFAVYEASDVAGLIGKLNECMVRAYE
jgi:hypothetical protein